MQLGTVPFISVGLIRIRRPFFKSMINGNLLRGAKHFPTFLRLKIDITSMRSSRKLKNIHLLLSSYN